MSILGMDIGSSTTKIVEYNSNKIVNSFISENKNYETILEDFINKNGITKIEKIVLTGINANKINIRNYNVPIIVVDEFTAIGTGGLYVSGIEKAIIASVGTGTALIRAENKQFKHLGGSGVGAATLTNLCNKLVNTKSFDEIIKLSKDGDLNNTDLRIKDLTDENIKTLPPELTLANLGKLNKNTKRQDIVIGIVNMVFEVIGMMAAFATLNDNIKDVVLIGNIVSIPVVGDVLEKIKKTHGIKFIIPNNMQYAVVLGAIKYAI